MSKKIKNTATRVTKAMNGKGFYIALALCLAVIGVSGYYLYSSISSMATPVVENRTDISVSDDPYLPEEEQNAPVTGSADIEITFRDEEVPEVSETPEEEEKSVDAVSTPVYFFAPVSGGVTAAFSGGELVYSETFGDWRCHNGVDIAAENGEHVFAVAAGTVTALEDDPLYGTCVTIDHGSGLVSVYKGLQSIPTVTVGDHVNAGDCIGAVGTTSIAEGGDIHLHLEMVENGMAVDPMNYIG